MKQFFRCFTITFSITCFIGLSVLFSDTSLADINTSLGKYDVDLKFDKVSGKKIAGTLGNIYFEDDTYRYYANLDDESRLYRKSKDDNTTAFKGNVVISGAYSIPYAIEGDYIYYKNSNDNYKLFKIKKDGTEVNSGGIKVIDVDFVTPLFSDQDYFYYTNVNDGGCLYRIKKDGSEVSTGGTKVIGANAIPQKLEGDFVYYTNINDANSWYKVKKDGSEVETGGIKLNTVGIGTTFLFFDTDYLYYVGISNSSVAVYRIKKDGSDQFIKGKEILNIQGAVATMSNNFILDGENIYYIDYFTQGKLYRIKKDGSELLTGGTQITNSSYSNFLFDDENYIYVSSLNGGNNGMYRINKNTFQETKISDFYWEVRSQDDSYIYYRNYEGGLYAYYKVKKDGTDKNLYIEPKTYISPEISLDAGTEFIRLNIDQITPSGTDYVFSLSDDNVNFTVLDKALLSGSLDIDLGNLFGLDFTHKLYYKVVIFGDENNQTVTPEIKSVELFSGNEIPRSVGSISVSGGASCTSPYFYSVLNLFGPIGNLIFSERIDNYSYYANGCSIGSWLWGSKYTGNSCWLVGVRSYQEGYYVDFTCDTVYGITAGAANGAGSANHIPWSGTFTLSKTKFNFCSYDSRFCTSNSHTGSSVNYLRQTQLTYSDQTCHESITQKPISNTQSKGDPVTLSRGEFTYDNTVMYSKGTGIDFNFALSYKNQAYYNGPVGNNFDFNYNIFYTEQADGTITVHDGELGATAFTKNGETYETLARLRKTLEKVGDVFVMTDYNARLKYEFGTNKRLVKLSDFQGNSLNFSYNDNGQLLTITDTLGQVYTLSYYDHSRLHTLVDTHGNEVTFTYFSEGESDGSQYDLKQITLKNGTQEKNISFTYTTGSTFEEAHNIVKLYDSKNQVYVENTYENDRVTSQKYGNGTIYYVYEVNGDVVTKNTSTDRNGNVTEYSYDANGNTTQKVIHTTNGNQTYLYAYNEENRLIKETFPKGNGYTYAYDSYGRLTQKRQKQDASSADSQQDIVTLYAYTGDFATPTSVTYPNGRVETRNLDTNGNIIAINTEVNGQSRAESFVYNSYGQITESLNSAGVKTQYLYSGANLVSVSVVGSDGNAADTQTTHFTYDAQGNILTKTDALGHTTTLTYDEWRRITEETTPSGIVKKFEYDANNKMTKEKVNISGNVTKDIVTTYNVLDNPQTIREDIDATHTALTTMAYNGNEKITTLTFPNGLEKQYTYDEQDRVIQEKTVDGSTISTTQFVYDANGNIVSTDTNGNTTAFMYDLFDRPTQITDVLGNTRSYTYDKLGNILTTQVKNASNNFLQHSSFEYDNEGKKLKETSGTTGNEITTEYTYRNDGKLLTQKDAKGNVTTFTYDTFGRLSETTLPNELVTRNTYNKNNQVVKKEVISSTKTLSTRYQYDMDGRVIKEIDDADKETSYTYNALNQVVSVTDKKGIKTDYTYDFRGKVLTESTIYTSPQPSPQGEGGIGTKTISYQYDVVGNLVKLTDANGNITTYTYDARGNKLTEIDAKNKTTTFTYDYKNNVTTKTDANGTITTYTYDALNRLTRKDIALGSGVGGVTYETYTYDGLGRLVDTNDSQGNHETFTYNALNQLVSETNNGGTITYEYDANGNNTKITYPSGKVITKTYDTLDRMLDVLDGTNTVNTYNYNQLNLQNETLGNGLQTNYVYDALNRIQSISHTPSFGTGLLNNTLNFSYDDNSNITSNGVDTYTYDTLNQLTETRYTDTRFGVNIDGVAHTYDLMGNRIDEQRINVVTRTNKKGVTTTVEKKKIWGYTTNNLNQYLDVEQGETGSTLTGETDEETDTGSLQGRLLYDSNGNLIGNMINSKREYEYKYDYKNRLIEVNRYNTVTEKETLIAFTYDTLGRRLTKKVNNQLTRYVYSNQDAVEETLYTVNPNNGNQVKKESREYIYGAKGVDDVLTMQVKTYKKVGQNYQVLTDDKYYYSKDQLGSVTRITSSTGTVIEEYTYNEFGKPYRWNSVQNKFTPVNGAKSSIGNTRMFTGREYDREVMLYYNRARYYDANLGRFISRDPIGIADDVNLYGYVGNNPVNATDPSGLEKILIIISADYNGQMIEFGNDGYATNWEGSYVASTYNRIKSELDRAGKKYDIRLANTFSEFDRAINEKQRDEIKFIGHGTPGYLLTNADDFAGGRKNEMLDWVGKGTGVSHYRINKENLDADTQTVEETERLKNTTLTLYSCNAGHGDNSIAQAIENHYSFKQTVAPSDFIYSEGSIYADKTEYHIGWTGIYSTKTLGEEGKFNTFVKN